MSKKEIILLVTLYSLIIFAAALTLFGDNTNSYVVSEEQKEKAVFFKE